MDSEAAAELAALKLDSSHANEHGDDQSDLIRDSMNENAESLDDGGMAKSKTKKKKKKKVKSKMAPQAAMDPGAVLPSQKLVESLFPWTAVGRPSRGRCAIATRAIKAGEVVIAERAVAFVPRTQDRMAVCHECCRDLGQSTPSVECSGCKHVVYCKDCEASAMASHRKWCKISQQLKEIAKMSDCDEDLLRFVLALALKRPVWNNANNESKEDDTEGVGILKDGVLYPTFQDALGLQTHKDKVTEAWKGSVRKGCSLLFSNTVLYSEGTDLTSGTGLQSSCLEELEMLALLVSTNAHGMGAQGLHNTDVALGIFPFVSMLNHSCWPNCCFASEGSVMTVRATQDIPKDTELCVSYINLYEPRGVRKQSLMDTKHFDCTCLRCSEPLLSSVDRFLEAAVCSVKGCVGVQVKSASLHGQKFAKGSSSWECDFCSRVTNLVSPAPFSSKSSTGTDKPWVLEDEAEKRLAAAMGVYQERKFKDARVLLERFLAEFTGKLHPLHVLLFDALTPLMNCCRALGDAGEAARVCRNIITCLEKVLPGFSLELANFYFCLGEMYSEREDASSSSPAIAKRYHKQAQETFQKVRAIRKICLGIANLPPH